MPKEFEITREFEVDATPEQVWDALTTGTGGWLWPMEYEPREGGAAPFGGTVTHWDPPHRLTGRVEDPEGVSGQPLNQLDHTVEPREDGRRAWVRYVHSGIFTDDWDSQYDGASKHTDFYLHTLRQYLTHFAGRPVAFATLQGPGASSTPEAFDTVGRALGLPEDAVAGMKVRAHGPDSQSFEAVVDYRTDHFIGLRTDTALYRYFGRNQWGAPVGVSVHDFAEGADGTRNGQAWEGWLTRLFG